MLSLTLPRKLRSWNQSYYLSHYFVSFVCFWMLFAVYILCNESVTPPQTSKAAIGKSLTRVLGWLANTKGCKYSCQGLTPGPGRLKGHFLGSYDSNALVQVRQCLVSSCSQQALRWLHTLKIPCPPFASA